MARARHASCSRSRCAPYATLHRVLTGQGQTRVARAFWLLSLLDHTSVHTARAAGADPYEIDRIVELKQALAAAT